MKVHDSLPGLLVALSVEQDHLRDKVRVVVECDHLHHSRHHRCTAVREEE